MSGGSYNYLCYKEPLELVNPSWDEWLEAMHNRLAGLAYAGDAARETLAVSAAVASLRQKLPQGCDLYDLDQRIYPLREFLEDPESRFEDLDWSLGELLGKPTSATAAAQAAEAAIKTIQEGEAQIGAHQRRLSSVWRAVEWWDSMDSSEGDLKAALEEYRRQGPSPATPPSQ